MTLTLEQAQAQAVRVGQRLQTLGMTMSPEYALEVVAAVHGDLSWDSLQRRLGHAAALTESERAALAVEAPDGTPTLHVYTVTLFRRHPTTAELKSVVTTAVVCFTPDQARDFVFREFWSPQYDRTGYAPSYETKRHSFEGICNLDMFIDWLTVVATVPSEDSNPCAQIWQVLSGLGAVPPTDQAAAVDPLVLETAVFQACRSCPDMGALLAQLYAVLPPGNWFMGAGADDFDGDDGRLKFSSDC